MASDELDPGISRRLEDVADRLDQISEELGDLSMAILQDAQDSGSTSRPAIEKTLAQARRAVV
ncbi:MAG: hypothetical protein ACK5PP_06700 [Acidimicrobiales bacterium]